MFGGRSRHSSTPLSEGTIKTPRVTHDEGRERGGWREMVKRWTHSSCPSSYLPSFFLPFFFLILTFNLTLSHFYIVSQQLVDGPALGGYAA
ncbi:hypothetical protein IE53DRAFT_113316 [Violaceomyces palustris]|uniref:Uncharacterized protein n=1 Tax=Violaceomyces palustris TaxID=1673888 RepID=A0ACD0NW53_9BASI|nr:hypothetical protein IE53DRAFT_113316 [Violaceomyces palustris]